MDELDIIRRHSVVLVGEIYHDKHNDPFKSAEINDSPEKSDTEIHATEKSSRCLSYCVIFIGVLVHSVLTVCLSGLLYWIYVEETTRINFTDDENRVYEFRGNFMNDTERLYYMKVVCSGLLVLIYGGSLSSLYYISLLIKAELKLKNFKRCSSKGRKKCEKHKCSNSESDDSEMSFTETVDSKKSRSVLPGFLKGRRFSIWRDGLEDDEDTYLKSIRIYDE